MENFHSVWKKKEKGKREEKRVGRKEKE